ncbi:MAG: hypothetical protein UHS51_01935 [Atopobiaceae bacterium]|jgi:hypothetical protein|nr:hypothetical protein [Atopobiaceae bacterium]
MGHEETARTIHRAGNNCSISVDRAFSDINKVAGNPPAPRSVAGKCGALLAAQKVLRDLGIDRDDELERAFEQEFGYVTCLQLKLHRRSCNDCVGVASRLADQMIAEAQ